MKAALRPGLGLVVTVVLIAGCGGSSSSSSASAAASQKAEFKASFGPVVGHFKQDSRAIGAAIEQARSQTDAQIGARFHDLAGRWQNALSQLETLKPPSNLAAPFNTLRDAANRTEADLTAITAAAATHSSSAAKQASASLVTDILSAKSASTAITQKLGIQ